MAFANANGVVLEHDVFRTDTGRHERRRHPERWHESRALTYEWGNASRRTVGIDGEEVVSKTSCRRGESVVGQRDDGAFFNLRPQPVGRRRPILLHELRPRPVRD